MKRVIIQRIAIGIGVVAVLTAIIAPVAYFTTRPDEAADDSTASEVIGSAGRTVSTTVLYSPFTTNIPSKTDSIITQNTNDSTSLHASSTVSTSSRNNPTTVTPNTQSENPTGRVLAYANVPEGERIDCFPESKSGVDTVDKSKCSYERHCVFDENSRDTPCYFPREKGYVVRSVDRNGLRIHLGRAGYRQGPFPGNKEHITFEIEEYGDRILRFKVIFTCVSS